MSEMPDDVIDVSLRDLDPPLSPESPRHSIEPCEAANTTDGEEEDDDSHLPDSEIGSAGGFSPPAWRRHVPPPPRHPLPHQQRHRRGYQPQHPLLHAGNGMWRGPVDALGTLPFTREHTPESRLGGGYDSCDDSGIDSGILEQAIRTRLPRGSESPMKGRSLSPEPRDESTLRLRAVSRDATSPIAVSELPIASENCECPN